MLYLDYSRKEGEWIPNEYGGKENIGAIEFLRSMNAGLYERHPDIMMIAEESTSWPMVSHPAYVGGLGFGMKWNMGWMHDTLAFFSQDSVFRKYHINQITFSIWYAFSENFMLPLSHDEVVHGKGSIYARMPGDHWQKMANLRLLYGYMYTHPGKKLLFMGAEFGQRGEWQHDFEPEWFLLGDESHMKLKHYVADINKLYRNEPALHDLDFDYRGFEWIDFHDADASIISYLRIAKDSGEMLLVCFNFTPVPRDGYTVGVPRGGHWQEVLNSDAGVYGGTDWGNLGGVEAFEKETHGRPYSVSLTVPPLGMIVLRAPKE
jgi:1,4-alpha-glucan branching enzyme